MQNIQEINFKKLYDATKQRITYETKPIKKLLFYNYINDDINTLIVDCRNTPINYPSINTSDNKVAKIAYRIIFIVRDNANIKTDSELESARNYLRDHDELTLGIFTIFETNYKEFIVDYPFMSDVNYSSISNYCNFHLPICVLNKIIYVGGFINSKNKKNLSLLGIKTVVSIMGENDKELSDMFGENYRNFENDESIHDEVEFTDITDFIMEQISKNQTPVLVYCFSGKSSSLAAIAAFLMVFKKWPLQFAVGYVLKLSPSLDMPSWLFTQLARWDSNKQENKK